MAVIPVSFTPTRYLAVPEGEWSLRHYRALVENPAWAQGAWLSIRIGVVASLLATALGLLFSLGIWLLRPRFTGLLMGIVLLPMVAPPVVSALTLYFFLVTLSKLNGLVAFDTWAGVALAHTVMIAPFAVVLVEFPDHPGVRVVGRLRGCAPDDVAIGMPVDVGFEPGPGGFSVLSFVARDGGR